VVPSGAGWVERFHVCRARAASVTVTCESAHLDDDELFAFAARVSMGQAINRARSLSAAVHLLAIWDGVDTGLPVGTSHETALWRSLGRPDHVVAVAPGPGTDSPGPARRLARRPIRALLFGDLQGFSQLRDEQIEPFVELMLGAVAATVERHREAVDHGNTWGDGLFVAFTGVAAAARCALAIHGAIAGIDFTARGLPNLRMRLAAHVGPVTATYDPVRALPSIFGRELTRAARIEPRTPPGEVYATEAFAALLALEPDAGIACEYVGHLTTDKEFETIPMYVLRGSRTAGA